MKILDVVFLFQMKEGRMIQWHSRRHSHPDPQFEFHYFLGGEGTFLNGQKSYPIEKGSFFLSVPGQVHQIQARDLEHPLSYYALLFEAGPEHPLYQTLTDPAFQATFPRRIGTSHRLFFEDAKNRFNQAGTPHRVRAVELRLEALVHDLVDDHGDSPPDAYNLHVEQALGILQSHVSRPLTLAEVCEQLKITQEHLIRLFQRHMNTTPMRYLGNLKLETATSLLLNSDLSVKEISWKLGFSSQYHFSRNFKAYAGCTPTQYRANYFANNPTDYHMKLPNINF